ncbi:hypothetical protein A2524_01000 [Candidatus Wolfebacteria bacterium RIFOXYD12_FULL_48_21]|uniref:Glycosyltransferase RgtA/B/C/D-like domain-containing protein n=1 Tax=Candidatus Wolfebacteria bacterium RIFOXYD1_FULL_48_65 TaxID=1802561 RepID=A0A1F8E096_9BACT|nr:MAG: hypothetical protein A2610_02945 [Candidatus Wolfebacteria bacterium RIFOXYD1_FULL_48_65]OGM94386.1 MAG: hypothetical protein A2524_01000 [Candidatus Wolfebacteria bacterium RIFOXYD12_FULL_48_21]OGM96927.1 MAG: hypothetical protein A2532_01200 [Candidatus Wolfebacteria bacterium RIFOXYD2_FULL_48_11]
MTPLFTNPKRFAALLLFGVIIIASFLRLYNISEAPPGLYPDEAMNGNNALEALSTGQFKTFYPENNGREGFFINLQALSIAIFGNEPWALRLVSALFGILTVAGVFVLTRELFLPAKQSHVDEEREPRIRRHEKIALLAAFCIATSFWHIIFSRIGFRAIMAPFFMTWGTYLTLMIARKLEEFKMRQQAETITPELGAPSVFAVPKEKTYWGLNLYTLLFSVAAGFVFGLGFNSYIAYRIMPLIPMAMFVYWYFSMKDARKELAKTFVIFAAAAAFAVLPLVWHFAMNPQDFFGRTSQISVFSAEHPIFSLVINIGKTIGMFFVQGDMNWRHNLAGRAELFWPVGLMFLVGMLGALGAAWTFLIRLFKGTAFEETHSAISETATLAERTPPLALLIPLAWLLVAALPVVISNEGIPHALRAILMIPPVFILAGAGGIWLYDRLLAFAKGADPESTWSHVKEMLLKILAIIVLVLLPCEAYYIYFQRWNKDPNTFGAFAQNYVDLGRELNALPKETPKYIIVHTGGTEVRGMPMPTQTVMFITDTFTPGKQKEKNMFYLLPERERDVPFGARTFIID